MATRPIFVPITDDRFLVEEVSCDFKWHPGMAVSQKQKSIAALHAAGNEKGITPILEVSTKSISPYGQKLSAFNLAVELAEGARIALECAFQGSKVFERGGPFSDLYHKPAGEARMDPRLKESGALVGFQYAGERWELEPKTAFYDWLYLNTAKELVEVVDEMREFRGFTDIEFNPEKSLNCQARSAALLVALLERRCLDQAVGSRESFLRTLRASGDGYVKIRESEGMLFG